MKFLVLPDVQIRPEDDTTFLTAIGNYIVAKQPDCIVCLGDFSDMSSLSSYDVGKKSFEGRRYLRDIEATKAAMGTLLRPLGAFNAKAAKNKEKRYKPKLVMLYGNHEHRIEKAVNNDAKLEGVLKLEDLAYEAFGWECHPFLEVVVKEGVAFSHYFTSGMLGRPCASAQTQLTKKHMSCIAGHQQGLQIATSYRADGTRLTSIIAGSCYEHDEDYLGPQGNNHWRGVVVLHDVHDGSFDLMPVSLSYLKSKYL
jgi:hypothetical protein